MRKLLAAVTISALFIVGCGRTSQPVATPRYQQATTPGSQPGKASSRPTPGENTPDKSASIPSIHATDEPRVSLATNQMKPVTAAKGKTVSATIYVGRDRYDGAVNVKISPPADSGITVEPANFSVPAGDTRKDVKVTVAAGAKSGKIQVPVTVSGATATHSATSHLEVDVP